MNAIEVQDLSKTYRGNIKAIRGLSFTVTEGSVFGFLGPNGAGKSTAIKILVTLIQATGSSGRIFGVDVARRPKEIRRMIGYVPQELSADGSLTGYENLLLAAKLYDIPPKEREQRIDEIFEMMYLSDRADNLIDTYSGGWFGDWKSAKPCCTIRGSSSSMNPPSDWTRQVASLSGTRSKN